MWSAGVAALLTARFFRRDLASFGWHWPRPASVAWCYLLPLGYTLAAYLLVWGGFPNPDFVAQTSVVLGWGRLPAWLFVPCFFVFNAVCALAPSLATALGEEIGWRGLLVPGLARVTSYSKVSLVSGLIRAVWHSPILLYENYNNDTPAWVGLSCFTVLVVSLSFVYTWFRLQTGSLWTGVLRHASHNIFVQAIFMPLTRDTGPTKYAIDEFGLALPVVCLVVAWLFWRRRRTLAPAASARRPALLRAV